MGLKHLLLTATAALAAPISLLTSTSTGAFTFTLPSSNATYYSPLAHIHTFSSPSFPTSPLPLTVFKTPSKLITASLLSSLSASYTSQDDVWNPSFLPGGALAISCPEDAVFDSSAADWFVKSGVKHLLHSGGIDTSTLSKSSINVLLQDPKWNLKPGLYTISFTAEGVVQIREVYRLYRDSYEAFLFGTTPVPGTKAMRYEAVEIFIPGTQDVWVPVPSRLYALGDERPLAGVRVGLKDIYDLEGTVTGGGSRSYAEVYGVVGETAVSVKRLVELGAVMVGKTKTSQFAHGADPWQFVDVHYPWNPRGDGYLTAASSSSGSAAAIAAYEWLDITIGSDTRGSVRKPAALVGSYGIRPTWGSMDLSGVIPLATEMDTAGFFARDPELFVKISKLWFEDAPVPVNKTFAAFPTKIIYPLDYFPVKNPAAQAIFDGFIATLETELGMVRTLVNLSATIAATVSNPILKNSTAFQLSSNRLAEYVSYNQVGIPLSKTWNAAFPGTGAPPLDPNPRNAFRRSVNLTEDDYQTAVTLKNEFRDFFLTNVLRPDEKTCSDGIMVLDMGTGGLPSYREQALNSLPGATALSVTVPGGGPNMPSNYLASTAGCPQVGIPVGQVSYVSEISGQEEMLPINVDLVAAPGCDGMLLALVEKLAEIGVARGVKVGRRAF
ncbi:amidase signature enzyme [Podospora aff. communis PSN243]|uniref:Amidase signature enzyme n=1 Tax=Podospora aff. communis PSN243 TaxID=3040156 RepID=A0AAV9GWR1_9PEZI|nr:amidase signature enzyme [Podospora aff. communis PSN243]